MQEFLKDGSIRNIIFQTGQFDCVRETINNQYNPQNIYKMAPEEIHYQIADWAMAGNKINEVGIKCVNYNFFMNKIIITKIYKFIKY